MRGDVPRAADPPRGFVCLHGDANAPFLRDLPPFRPRFPWRGGDLQTLRNSLVPAPGITGTHRERLEIPLRDPECGSLSAVLDRPQEEYRRPLFLLVHGLGGCEDSAYMRLSARALTGDGHGVVRLNLRGADPARCSRGPYHAGLTADLVDVLALIAARWPRRGVIAVGFSLGGHLLLRLAAEPRPPANLAAIVSVSAPLDLATTARRMAAPRNRIYERRLVAWLRRHRFRDGIDVPASLRRISDFDRAIVVPAHGFRDLDAYYGSQSAMRTLERIGLPTLAIHADDDPWIPVADYRRAPWPGGDRVTVLLGRGGGHVGFHGEGLAFPWYVAAIRAFRDHPELHDGPVRRRDMNAR